MMEGNAPVWLSYFVVFLLGGLIGWGISIFNSYWKLKHDAKEKECEELKAEVTRLGDMITYKIKDGKAYIDQVKDLKGQLLHYREKTKYVDVYKNMVISILQVLPNQEIFIPSVIYMTLEFERWEIIEQSNRKEVGTTLWLKETRKWKTENNDPE